MYCPISGEYTGVLPDAPGLCAKESYELALFYSKTQLQTLLEIMHRFAALPQDIVRRVKAP